jgi:hypothetical protein
VDVATWQYRQGSVTDWLFVLEACVDRQAYLLHQVHAAKLATDISAGIVSGWLMWQRRVPAARGACCRHRRHCSAAWRVTPKPRSNHGRI